MALNKSKQHPPTTSTESVHFVPFFLPISIDSQCKAPTMVSFPDSCSILASQLSSSAEVFHGGSGSEKEAIATALSAGVVLLGSRIWPARAVASQLVPDILCPS